MALPIGASDLVPPLLLVKALLAVLAVFIFLYYRHYWNMARGRLPIHYFFTKWRAVRHAYFLGLAAIGFAIGFAIELLGVPLGLSPNLARILSSLFEALSLFSMLYVFFSLAIEDVPHFQRLSGAPPRQPALPKEALELSKKQLAGRKPLRKHGKKRARKATS
jgi:hypothetical protein